MYHSLLKDLLLEGCFYIVYSFYEVEEYRNKLNLGYKNFKRRVVVNYKILNKDIKGESEKPPDKNNHTLLY